MATVYQRTFLLLTVIYFYLEGSSGLECYKCVNGWTSKLCEQKSVTCSAGELCFNTLERKQFEGRVYTKGCKERDACYDLQSLNDRKTCRDTPSICVYCCSEDWCNQGQIIRVNNMCFAITFLYVFIICYMP